MPRRKSKKSAMSDPEPEALWQSADDEEDRSSPGDAAEQGGDIQWTPLVDDDTEDEGDEGAHRADEADEAGGSLIQSSSAEADMDSFGCASSAKKATSSAAGSVRGGASSSTEVAAQAPAMSAAQPHESEQSSQSERWQELAAEAAGLDIEAMHRYQDGKLGAATDCYRQVVAKLLEAAESLEPGGAVRKMLEQRAREASDRVETLEAAQAASSRGLSPHEAIPLESRAKLTTEVIQASMLATIASERDSKKSSVRREDAKVLGTAAAIGGAAGLALLGPLGAAGLGAAAVYATTKDDSTGQAARSYCETALSVADGAMNKAVDTGLKAVDVGLDETRRRLLESAEGSGNGRIQQWCGQNKDKVRSAVATVDALKASLPMHKLREDAQRMKMKYPDRVPVYCERGRGARSDLPDIQKKLCIDARTKFAEFKYIVQKTIKHVRGELAADETLYIFIGEEGMQPKSDATMGDLYKRYNAEEGFLLARYTAENTLG